MLLSIILSILMGACPAARVPAAHRVGCSAVHGTLLHPLTQTGKPALQQNDIAYGPDSLHRLDISLVADRTPETPLVILIHGGGWMAGDKAACKPFLDFFNRHGCNTVNINYRLANATTIHYQEIMKDIDQAVGYVVAHADKWGIRKKKIILWGGSAGGHLAMLYAYNYDKRNVVSSIISLGGPTKLDDRPSLAKSKKEDIEGLLPLITGKPWSNDSLDLAYRLASPWYGLHLKPSLVIHGEVDTIVSWLQAQLMSDKLTSEGVDNQFFLIKNGWHGGEGASKETTDSLNITVNHWVRTHS